MAAHPEVKISGTKKKKKIKLKKKIIKSPAIFSILCFFLPHLMSKYLIFQ